jgi:NTE family protein
METALITGGGDYIAFTIGRLKALKKDYDVVIGTSAGALITPLVALGFLSRAEDAIANITPDKIFNVNPFNKKGHIKIFKAVWRILIGKRTLGENHNLPKLIKEFYKEEDHRVLQGSTKKAYVTLCNTNKADYPGEIVCLNNCTYDEAVNYMWASASVPLVCSLVKIGDYEYADGGTTLNAPADFLVELGIKKMDVFLHDTEPMNENRPPVKSVFNMLGRIIKWQRQKVQYDQILSITSMDSSIKTKLYWLPYQPAEQSLMFNRDIMMKYMNAGFLQVENMK